MGTDMPDPEVAAAFLAPLAIALFALIPLLGNGQRKKLLGSQSDIETVDRLRENLQGWNPPEQKHARERGRT